jgi:hypothetical protein
MCIVCRSPEEEKCGNRFKKNVGPSGPCEPATGDMYRDINPNLAPVTNRFLIEFPDAIAVLYVWTRHLHAVTVRVIDIFSVATHLVMST